MAAPLLRMSFCRTRHIYATVVHHLHKKPQKSPVCYYSSGTDSQTTARNGSQSKSDKILGFFNNCDLVALRKLMALNPTIFQYVKVTDIVQKGDIDSDRFDNFEGLQGTLRIDPNDISLVEVLIDRVYTGQVQNTKLLKATPRINETTMENVHKVVAVDMFLTDVAWSEETRDRTVLSVGHETFDMDFKHIRDTISYDHVMYQNKALEIVRKIPESTFYAVHSCIRQTKSKQAVHYHQTLMEALIITLLNCRNNHRMHSGTMFRNKVFLINQRSLLDFYSAQFTNDLFKCDWMVKNSINHKPGPLHGLHISDEAASEFETTQNGQGPITKCILLSDMICRLFQSP